MKKVSYALGYAAALWMLFALWVRVMTLGDIAPVVQPYYDGIAPLLNVPAVWLLLSAAIACGAIVRLFRGKACRPRAHAAESHRRVRLGGHHRAARRQTLKG